MSYKLVCFDMDGVIFKDVNFWMKLHKKFGTLNEGIELTKKYLHTDYDRLVEEVVVRLWKGKDDKNICLAHAKKDISYCKLVSANGDKKHCYFGLSMISGDIDVCDGIDYDKNERELCYWSFANALYWEGKSDKITTEHCNKLPAGSQSRDSCLAFKERDVSYCKGDVNCLTCFERPISFCTTGKGKALEYCIRDRVITSKNISICETLTGALRDDCLGDYAGHITQDILTCDKINDYFLRNSCYKDVAIQTGTNFWFNLCN
ncbi:MAG: hypothetical protein U9Q69_05050 [Nanoarchaeota archaeon]|nr:hypothetical protein [Nanoarchaeota archaeon]